MRLLLLAWVVAVACGPVAPTAQPSPLESEPGAATTPATPEPSVATLPELASAPAGACQGLAHVYHPQRLQVLNPCVQAKGVVQSVKAEPDGDQHIRITPDLASLKYLNAKNQGLLVLEPVCTHTVTQRDAIAACQGYHNPQPIPRVGQHLTAVGPWVLDTVHGWREIHPATWV